MSNEMPGYLAKHGIVPWHLYMVAVMFISTIIQFVSFRTHTEDFEVAADKDISAIEQRLVEFDKRLNAVTAKYGVINNRLDHIDSQISRLVQQNDKIIDRLSHR